MDIQGHNMTGNLSSLVNATNGTVTFAREDDYGDHSGDHYGEYVLFDWATESYIPALLFLANMNVIGFCGIVGNVMILVVFQHRTLSFAVYSVYLRFLAVSDLGVIVFRVLESNLQRDDRYHATLTLSVSLCKVYKFLKLWFTVLSPWLVVCLTTDRFIAVTYPLHWKSVCTKRKALVTCVLFTGLAGLFNIATLFVFDVFPDSYDGAEILCYARQGYGWHEMALLMLGSAIPCGFIFLLNMLILGRIRATSRQRVALTGAGGLGALVAVATRAGGPRPCTLPPSAAAGVGTGTGLNSSDIESPSVISPSDGQGKTASDQQGEPNMHGTGQELTSRTPGAREGGATQPGRTPEARESGATQPGRTAGERGSDGRKTRDSRVDKATVSLTFLSVAAFLTLAPSSALKGLFTLLFQQYDDLLEVDPYASVPENLKTIVRVWDLLEIVYLLNFCINFYILLVTNRQFAKATRDTVGRCATVKRCRFSEGMHKT